MQGIHKLDRFPHLSMLLLLLKKRPVWCLHWPAFSSQKDFVCQLTQFAARERRSGMNRIVHPDWVKLSVELNCAPNQNMKFSFHYKYTTPTHVHHFSLEYYKKFLDACSAFHLAKFKTNLPNKLPGPVFALILFKFPYCPVGWGYRIHQLLLFRGVRHLTSNECLEYDTKRSRF